MKKSFISSFLGLLILNNLTIFSCSATNNDLSESKNDNLIETTQEKDGNLLTKTQKENNVQQGKIINISLNTNNFDKNLLNEKLKIITNSITKNLEKDFNKKNNIKVNNLISNINIEKGLSGTNNISFEVNFYENIKDKIGNYLKDVFDNKNIEALKTSLKKIVKDNYSKEDSKDAANDVIKKLDEKIQNTKNNKQSTLEKSSPFNSIFKNQLPFDNLFTNFTENTQLPFDNLFTNFMENTNTIESNLLKDSDEEEDAELVQDLKQTVINNLNGKKTTIENYINNSKLQLEDINKVIDSITSVNSNGEFSRVSSSLKQVSSQKN